MKRAASVDSGGEVPRRSASSGAADLLALAAAPTLAVMALITELSGGGAMEMHGHAAHGAPVGEMTTMYLLMAVFHAAPWLRLVRAGTGTKRHPLPQVIPAKSKT